MAPTALCILASLLITQVYGTRDTKPCNIQYGCNDPSTLNGVAFMMHLLGNHLTSCKSKPEEEMYWVEKLNKCFNVPESISEPSKNCTTSVTNEQDDPNTDQGSNSEAEGDCSGSPGDKSTNSSSLPLEEIPKEGNSNSDCDTSGRKPEQGTTGDTTNSSGSPNETPEGGKSNRKCDTSGRKPEQGATEEDSGQQHIPKPCQTTTTPAINNPTVTKPTSESASATPQTSNQCSSDNESETDSDYYDYNDSDCSKEDYTKSAFWKPFVEAIISEMCRCHSESRANKQPANDRSDKGSPKHHQSSRGSRSSVPRAHVPIAASPAGEEAAPQTSPLSATTMDYEDCSLRTG